MTVTLHDKRKMNKMSLDTFVMDDYNRFDYVSDQAINGLKKENEKAMEDYESLSKMKEEDKARWDELQEVADRIDVSLDRQMADYHMDTIYRIEEMVAIMEMKIAYAFKHLEVNIKKLVSAAYTGTDTKDLYKWNSLMVFLKSKTIIPESLDGYHDVQQLLQVNNKIKHESNIYEKLQGIKEFKGLKGTSFESLEKFYNRVKRSPDKFLTALSSAIYKNLYDFDDARLQSLAESLVLQLEKPQALKLISLIQSYYMD